MNQISKKSLDDKLLEEISGGAADSRNSFAFGFRKENEGSTGSGKEPKFAVMQTVGIQYRQGVSTEVCKCQVISVSNRPDSGALFQEYTYTVWVMECTSNPSEANVMLTGVHESCLQEL